MNEKDEIARTEKPASDAEFHHLTVSDIQIRRWVSWVAVAGTTVLGGFFFGFMIFQTVWGKPSPDNWLTTTLEKHYAGMVGTPMSAVTAYCIVTLLKVTNGPIEFEALGFKFRGASGPIVLWIFSFLAVGCIFHLLWGSAL
jgi:hypothetical protein